MRLRWTLLAVTLTLSTVVWLLSGCVESSFRAEDTSDVRSRDDPDAGPSDMGDDSSADADATTDPATDPTTDPAIDPAADPAADISSDPDADEPDPDGREDQDAGDVEPDPGPYVPARYPADTLLSPITAYVADELRAIAAVDATRQNDVFMKVGASGTVSHHLLYCFAGEAQPQYDLELDGRDELLSAIAVFRGGDAAGTTPFDRASLAAEVGMSAVWAISGSPSPLDQEIAALDPRVALINYGTNDMERGVTHESALFPFYDYFTELLQQTTDAGIVPIVTGLNPRSDSTAAAQWVPTYNAVVRGVAEARQLPYINLYEAVVGLDDMGLVADGLHGNVFYRSSSPQPCVFTAEGLEYNYNVRNLLTIRMLDLVHRVVVQGLDAPDSTERLQQGAGSPEDPFVVDGLPFTHYADTLASPNSDIDAYPACDEGQNESGPEYLYRLTLAEQTAIRAVVLDGDGVDIDVHLLGASGLPSSCLERNHRIIQRTLPAGEYTFSLDTWVSPGGIEYPGAYLFVVVECEPGDSDCS